MAKYRFQLLRGSYRIGPVYGEKMNNGSRRIIKPGYNVKRGETFESTVDLATLYPSIPPKFLRIDVVQEEESDVRTMLMAMSKQQLIAKAEADEVDISGCRTVEQIVNRFLEVVQS